ncbi:MAG TPA: carboxypeptidase-like regulatory domain-containing protein [Planctomycetota bacterium]
MPPIGLQRLLTVPLLLLIGSLASADAITGRVVDANGVGVAGVDIDFLKVGGGNPNEANDGTDANGNFLTTVDAGVYEIRFFAPAPPASSHLTAVLTNVVVTGTKNLGNVVLPAGVIVQGTVRNAASQPVGNVVIDVFRDDTGARVLMKNNFTTAFGTFQLAVPANVPLRSEYLTHLVVGQALVPRRILGTVPFSVNVGTITLQTGFHLTGTMRTETGSPIEGADLDVKILPSGTTLFTPSDNTRGGIFDVIVPPGTYDLVITRPTNLLVVAVEVDDLTVSGPTDVGVHVMRFGVLLSGTVRDADDVLVPAVDLNVREVATGLSLPLGSDNTNDAGFYAVVVPPGPMHLVFSPPWPHSRFEKRTRDVLITNTNVSLHVVLPTAPTTTLTQPGVPAPLPPWSWFIPFGAASTGPRGAQPFLDGTRLSRAARLQLFGGAAGGQARLWIGRDVHPSPENPQVFVVEPLVALPVQLDGNGAAQLDLADRLTQGLGETLHAQLVVPDPAAPRGLALSHVLAIGLPR